MEIFRLNNKDVKISLWKQSEDVDFYVKHIENSELIKDSEKINDPKRKLQWLAARCALLELTNIENILKIQKMDNGKPYIPDHESHISLSHTNLYAAAAIADYAIGIDVEHCQRIFNPEVHKFFMTELEYSFWENSNFNPELFLVLWSCKESMFKLLGEKEISFKKNLLTFGESSEDYLKENGYLKALFQKNNLTIPIKICYFRIENCIITLSNVKI